MLAKIACAVLLQTALLFAADAKTVINAVDEHNRWAFTDEAMRGYRSAANGAASVLAKSQSDMARETADADAVIGGLSKDQFANAKKLKWVQTYSAGVEGYRWKEFLESSVTLTNCKILQGPNIADHAMALLLALTRGLNVYLAEKPKENRLSFPEKSGPSQRFLRPFFAPGYGSSATC